LREEVLSGVIVIIVILLLVVIFTPNGIYDSEEELQDILSDIDTKLQYCGSGMFIPDPDFYPSRIPDPKTATKERGEKICCYTFFCSRKKL
jgi:hypothetical protein